MHLWIRYAEPPGEHCYENWNKNNILLVHCTIMGDYSNIQVFEHLPPFSLGLFLKKPGRIAQSVGHLTCKSEVLGLIPSLATYFCFSFR